MGDEAARELDGAGAVGMKTVKIRRENLLESFRRGESTNWTYQLDDLRELPSLLEPLAG